MKKYIWAKDTPFSKKGEPVTIEHFDKTSKYFPVQEWLHAEGWIEEVNERWKPVDNEQYFFLTDSMLGYDFTFWRDFNDDKDKYRIGNCFRTREEAQAAAEKVKALLLSLHE